MACPSRLKGSPCTAGQQGELVRLFKAGALSRETAKGQRDPGMGRANANIIGALRDKDLADSRVVRAGASGNNGGQYTAYWLTADGLQKADELVVAQIGGA